MTKKQHIKREYLSRTRMLTKLLLVGIVLVVTYLFSFVHLPLYIEYAIPVIVWILAEDVIEHGVESKFGLRHRPHWFDKFFK